MPGSVSPPPSMMPPFSMDDREADNSSKPPQKAKRKALEYPAGLQRLTKYGRCTYGINTGPLSDDTDWSKLSAPILKEQLAMRNVPAAGKKSDLVERLNSWKTFTPETVQVRQVGQDFGDIGKFKSSKGEKRTWVGTDEQKHISAAKKAMAENMYIIKRFANFGSDDNVMSFSIRGSSSNKYDVTVGRQCSCTCKAQAYNKRSNCKHVIYALTHVLRAPAELLPQRKFFAEEIAKLMANAPKILPTEDEIKNDPTMKDGVPKSKEGKSCVVCCKDLDGVETVCCATCGHHTHSDCFSIMTEEALQGAVCPVCKAMWVSPTSV